MEPDAIDCFEWMSLASECEFTGKGISFAKTLEVFVRCNQDELGDFFHGNKFANPDAIKGMTLDFPGFCDAVLAVAELTVKKKPEADDVKLYEKEDPLADVNRHSTGDPLVDALERFLEHLLMGGKKQFPK